MKKTVIVILGLLGVSFVLSLFITPEIGKGIPGKLIMTSLTDPPVVQSTLTASLMIVFLIVLGTGLICSKKLKWGKWKTGLICCLELLFWFLIFWMAHVYSIQRIKYFSQGLAPLSAAPLMPKLKDFVFYFLRNVLIIGIGMHLLLGAGWLLARRLKKKKQVS